MRTRLLFITLLFPFCYTLLRAQTQESAVLSQATSSENGKTTWENKYTWKYDDHFDHPNGRNPCQVFIGVGTTPEAGGLKVDYTIDGTPASISGVQVGDIILALDNVPVSSYSELVGERDKHHQGDAFTLNILRAGSRMNINARFKSCSQEEQEQVRREEKALRPILGIFEKESDEQQPGLVIGEVIAGKGAALAGLQPGDVITLVDGKTIQGTGSLHAVLSSLQPGDPVPVAYLRDGQTLQTLVTLSGDRTNFSFNMRRDPCTVFIGVYTTDAGPEGRGVRVTGVIDGTPAKESDMQPGDLILALDDQSISTYAELQRERDKHQPGDRFRMTVLRDGSERTVNATFKACPKENGLQPTQEVVKLLPAAPVDQPTAKLPQMESTLEVTALDLFPNPTVGPLNVRLEAEAVPTTVRIIDAAGKTVYENVLRQFNGSFNEQISLEGQTPGVYTLTVQQGKRVMARNIVLMART